MFKIGIDQKDRTLLELGLRNSFEVSMGFHTRLVTARLDTLIDEMRAMQKSIDALEAKNCNKAKKRTT